MTLESLLTTCEDLFPTSDKPTLSTYNFTLGCFPYGWVFNVVNDWHKWMDRGFKTKFGAYSTPSLAIRAFLNYVDENKIDVMSLTNGGEQP